MLFPCQFYFLAFFPASTKISFCKEISLQMEALVTAYVLRFCRNIRIKSTRDESDDKIDIGPLKPEEIERSAEYWLKIIQATLAKKMKDGELKSLTPFVIDSKGIIRVGGRADPSLASYGKAHPALLPNKHWISVL